MANKDKTRPYFYSTVVGPTVRDIPRTSHTRVDLFF